MAELLLFENYSHSSYMLTFKDNNIQKKMYKKTVCLFVRLNEMINHNEKEDKKWKEYITYM